MPSLFFWSPHVSPQDLRLSLCLILLRQNCNGGDVIWRTVTSFQKVIFSLLISASSSMTPLPQCLFPLLLPKVRRRKWKLCCPCSKRCSPVPGSSPVTFAPHAHFYSVSVKGSWCQMEIQQLPELLEGKETRSKSFYYYYCYIYYNYITHSNEQPNQFQASFFCKLFSGMIPCLAAEWQLWPGASRCCCLVIFGSLCSLWGCHSGGMLGKETSGAPERLLLSLCELMEYLSAALPNIGFA